MHTDHLLATALLEQPNCQVLAIIAGQGHLTCITPTEVVLLLLLGASDMPCAVFSPCQVVMGTDAIGCRCLSNIGL